jgi:phage terminase Nu1 subunit (DNA packaging protein)
VNVVSLHSQQALTVGKAGLAKELGISTRTVENYQRQGMPFIEQLDRFGRRRYNLAAVRAWLQSGQRERPRDRLTEIEMRVREIERQLGIRPSLLDRPRT